MNWILRKSDFIGVISSSLCLLHCFATPLLFVAQTQMANTNNAKPIWWPILDLIFLIISVFAIYKTANTTTNKWIKIGLWVNWSFLSVIIINEKIMWFAMPEYLIYVPSLSLICIHIYNSKYCHCAEEQCCVNNVTHHG